MDFDLAFDASEVPTNSIAVLLIDAAHAVHSAKKIRAGLLPSFVLNSTPVNLLQVAGKPYLVAPRGWTQWVRNAEATGEILLKRGGQERKYRLRPVPDAEKPEILKLYLDSYKSQVQQYFPVPAGSPPAMFREILADYPVFELLSA